MDEPLSNLDATLRVQTRADIVSLQRRLGTTTIYVTHDQVEAMTMGHRIAVLRAGRLQQVAAPQELYERPANTFVAAFIGSPGMNLVPAFIDGDVATVPERASTCRHASGAWVTARSPSGSDLRPRHWPRPACRRRWISSSCWVPRRMPSARSRTERAWSCDRGPRRAARSGRSRHDRRGHRRAARLRSGERRTSGSPAVSGRTTRRQREWGLAYLLIMPAIAVFAVFTFYPFIKNFKLALFRNPPYPGLPAHYVGLSQIGPSSVPPNSTRASYLRCCS